ncbi:unnamed protein product [Linum trigynum]|uniref:ZF-HD dimerization-type domain-containing protein n=1 Tax=Linum trigynum TaxID=586398 RepID=A0AAV2CJB2_9ROSI
MSSGGGGGKRGDGNDNGNSTFLGGYSQTPTLDHHHRSGGFNNKSTTAKSTATATVRYRECLRNHPASMGVNVYDGFGEFMHGGEEGSLEALKCATCECHRNFHHNEVDGETAAAAPPPPCSAPALAATTAVT